MGESSDSTYVSSAPGATAGSMRGRVCVITGGNRGIGRATAHGLAGMGATVVILGRDAERCLHARDEIRHASGNAGVSYLVMDLASLESVRHGAAELARRFTAIHVLINNAGVNLSRRTVTPEGIEMTFAVNHLGPFLLTNLLLPLLRAGAPARIITVTSWFERLGGIDLDAVRGRGRYRPLGAYYQSKLANVLFTHALARRLAGTGVTANCVDPGLVATDLLRDRSWWNPPQLQRLWRRILMSPEAAARRLIHAASSPDLSGTTGVCLASGGVPTRTSRRSHDEATAEMLWRVSSELTGLEGRIAAP